MTDLLFVYGSLRSQFDNVHARRLRAESVFEGVAKAPGSVVQLGEYPAWRAEPAGVVQGEIYGLTDPARTFEHLDEYEGSEYRRIVVRLLSPDVDAWIYGHAQ